MMPAGAPTASRPGPSARRATSAAAGAPAHPSPDQQAFGDPADQLAQAAPDPAARPVTPIDQDTVAVPGTAEPQMALLASDPVLRDAATGDLDASGTFPPTVIHV